MLPFVVRVQTFAKSPKVIYEGIFMAQDSGTASVLAEAKARKVSGLGSNVALTTLVLGGGRAISAAQLAQVRGISVTTVKAKGPALGGKKLQGKWAFPVSALLPA